LEGLVAVRRSRRTTKLALGITVLLTTCTLAWMPPALAQLYPPNDLVFTVATTTTNRDGNGRYWSYVLIGAQQSQMLAGKHFMLFAKAGQPADPGPFTLRGLLFQRENPTDIDGLLAQSVALGENLDRLTSALNQLTNQVPGIASLPTLGTKVASAFQAARLNPRTAQTLEFLGRLHPGLNLCAGVAFAEPLTNPITTYEVREVDLATGQPGGVLGRVSLAAGVPTLLPPPGPPFQVTTNDLSDHLRIRLRWGTPPELRRLSLLSFGYNVWRVPLADALAANLVTNAPTTLSDLLLRAPAVKPVNTSPVLPAKEFTLAEAGVLISDPTTYFLSDSNGRSLGHPDFGTNVIPPGYLVAPFDECAQFVYFVTARDLLGNDGQVSPPGFATACRRWPPAAPTGVHVQNTTTTVNNQLQTRLTVSWQPNTNTDEVTEYWIYRWNNPTNALAHDVPPLEPLGKVPPNLLSFVDNSPTPDFPTTTAGSNTFWYTVRAVSQPPCAPFCDVLVSPQSSPAWGVLRERHAPDAPTGDLLTSCGTPVVILLPTNSLVPGLTDQASSNYRFTCLRRDQGIACVHFFATNRLGAVDTLGPLYFAAGSQTLSIDYTLPISGTNGLAGVGCVVETPQGQVSQPAFFSAPSDPPSGGSGRLEILFFSGQLLFTALDHADPLLAALNLQASYGSINGAPVILCPEASSPIVYPDGMVGLSFGPPSLPRLIQVAQGPLRTNDSWMDIAVATPDTNGVYWVSYPECVLGLVPRFRGCLVNLPDDGHCGHHLPRAADDGPVAPILIRFFPTPRTHEYRIYRTADDGPLTFVSQGPVLYDPLRPHRMVVRADNVMPPSAVRLCYFVQVLDENGNGSPLAQLSCSSVDPVTLPTPVLGEPQSAGAPGNPQVALNWFCPTAGVCRFAVNIARKDQNGSGNPTLFTLPVRKILPAVDPSAPSPKAFNPAARYAVPDRLGFLRFDETQLTPPIGTTFGPGPKFTITADLKSGVAYTITVNAQDRQGISGHHSKSRDFTWYGPTAPPSVPWPARGPVQIGPFDEDPDPAASGFSQPRVAVVKMPDHNLVDPIDLRYPVGIRIGVFDNPQPNSYQSISTIAQLVHYAIAGPSSLLFSKPPVIPFTDPNLLVFHRQSKGGTVRESLLPIVVYRQQVANQDFPRVSTNLTQVTPLLERLAYSAVTNFWTNTPASTVMAQVNVTIYDRLIAQARETNSASVVQNCLYLRDQQPVLQGAAYQYYVVRFNDQREISEIIPAGSVTIPKYP